MGMMAELVRVVSTALKRLEGSPATQSIVSAKGLGGANVQAEVYHPSGLFSRPPANTRGVFVPIGNSRRLGVVLGLANYNITINIYQGEVCIYSTTPDGKTIKATALFTKEGEIHLNGSTKSFVTHDELNSALQTFINALNLHVHPSTGAPPATPMSINIAAAKTTTIKTGG